MSIPMFDASNLWHWVILICAFPILWWGVITVIRVAFGLLILVVGVPLTATVAGLEWVVLKIKYRKDPKKVKDYYARKEAVKLLGELSRRFGRR